ncbi:hypothetical protein BV25DRAFT_1799476 [Artomyces pyxidatus]|uniref:Uncharacterized protein n=1 Tax=Artomyces pyxidatus TaxID=48021 RepID=A0ACB8T904_9AGAM|nr:hypothetical protein BV25DRAFT_1799476 [Artomyces pyxidatus]
MNPIAIPKPSPSLEWDWDIEHADRKREAKADKAVHNAQPFHVDRGLLRDVVKEKMECPVGRITFLSSGTFHKAYSVTLTDGRDVIARVARRFMSRLKTESEVATMAYIRTYTAIPVPTVYYYDSNPYNRLGGEYIIMSKAPGVPLSTVYQSMSHTHLVSLLDNLASLVIPLFAHRFSSIGSLYFGPKSQPNNVMTNSSTATVWPSTISTPTVASGGFNMMTPLTPMTSAPTPRPRSSYFPITHKSTTEFHVGSIISWPFFGSNRGDLTHPTELDRGPWDSTRAYLRACAEREIEGVKRENDGKSAPHRLHLDPDEIQSSRHHHLQALPDDASDESDEWDIEESEEEWDGPGDTMYRDYRRMQRTTFLVAHLNQREVAVRKEMERWMRMMQKLGVGTEDPGGKPEEFGMDLHDLSLENIFVDPVDHSKITCVIDWESTTIRPLWQCAHLPAFLQSSPFTARLFRQAVTRLADHTHPKFGFMMKSPNIPALAAEWLHWEAAGAHLRQAHRCAEWDGWEEGLVDSILGPEDQEDEWIREAKAEAEAERNVRTVLGTANSPRGGAFDSDEDDEDGPMSVDDILKPNGVKRRRRRGPLHATAEEKERERLLAATGDECGGRGGELGRRLEALLTINGDGEGSVRRPAGWDEQHEKEYEAEAE